MLLFKVILTSSCSLLIVCLISSTLAAEEPNKPEESTSIASLVNNTKTFFKKVKQLDTDLNMPQSIKKFRRIKRKQWLKPIRCDGDYSEMFKKEFKKFAGITKEVATNFGVQINKIKNNHEMGVENDRQALCEYYTNTFLPQLTIKGTQCGDSDNKRLEGDYKEELQSLYNTIISERANGRAAGTPDKGWKYLKYLKKLLHKRK